MLEPIIGMLSLCPYGFVPKHHFACDGAAYKGADYRALYSLLGNRFGGDATTFKVPNLKAPIAGLQYVITHMGLYPSQDGWMMDSYLATVYAFAFEFRMGEQTEICNGQTLNANAGDFGALYALVQNRFGAEHPQFNLPKLTPPTPQCTYQTPHKSIFPTVDGGPQAPAICDVFVGHITLWMGVRGVPDGFAACNGQTLKVQEFSSLFNVLGNRFGGDGKTTFNLPKLAPLADGVQYIIATNGRTPERA